MRKWLFELRKQKALTMKEVSSRLGISESYYSLIESGARQKHMDIYLLVQIADLFERPILRLIDDETKSWNPSA